jgi:hypothetical protein
VDCEHEERALLFIAASEEPPRLLPRDEVHEVSELHTRQPGLAGSSPSFAEARMRLSVGRRCLIVLSARAFSPRTSGRRDLVSVLDDRSPRFPGLCL